MSKCKHEKYIGGVCSKCDYVPFTQPMTESDWEKEFDNKFVLHNYALNKNLVCYKESEHDIARMFESKQIKEFIRKTIASATSQGARERDLIIKTAIKVFKHKIINVPVGSGSPLVVTESFLEKAILDALSPSKEVGK